MQLVDVGRAQIASYVCRATGIVGGLESHPRLRIPGCPGVLSISVRRAASTASFVSATHRSVGDQASARLAFGAGYWPGVEVGGHGGRGKGGAVDGDVGDAAGEEITAALQHPGPQAGR